MGHRLDAWLWASGLAMRYLLAIFWELALPRCLYRMCERRRWLDFDAGIRGHCRGRQGDLWQIGGKEGEAGEQPVLPLEKTCWVAGPSHATAFCEVYFEPKDKL